MKLNIREELLFSSHNKGSKIAIKTLGHSINYLQLYKFTSKAISFFSKLGIRSGQRVLIACPDETLNLMITLSLIRMGVDTCLNHGSTNSIDVKDFDWLLSSQPTEHISPCQFYLIDKNLIDQIESSILYDRPDAEEESAVILLSSGTVGEPKKIKISREILFERVFKSYRIWGFQNSLNLMRLSTSSGLNHALSRVFLGETLYLADNDIEAIELIKQSSIKTLIGSPIQLSQLISQLDASDLKDNLDKVIYSGSMAHERLLNTIRSKLSDNIQVLYDSTETGGISCALIPPQNPLGIGGFLLPDIQLEVILSSPEQEWGEVRIKSEYMATKYFGDDQLSQEYFKDGWFYPKDEGRLLNQNFLLLNQRESDTLIIGGVKINPLIIENQVHKAYEFDDLAVFELILPSGQGVVALAYTLKSESNSMNIEDLRQTLKLALAPIQLPQYFFLINQIPRNIAGKVLRKKLTEIISKNFLNEKIKGK